MSNLFGGREEVYYDEDRELMLNALRDRFANLFSNIAENKKTKTKLSPDLQKELQKYKALVPYTVPTSIQRYWKRQNNPPKRKRKYKPSQTAWLNDLVAEKHNGVFPVPPESGWKGFPYALPEEAIKITPKKRITPTLIPATEAPVIEKPLVEIPIIQPKKTKIKKVKRIRSIPVYDEPLVRPKKRRMKMKRIIFRDVDEEEEAKRKQELEEIRASRKLRKLSKDEKAFIDRYERFSPKKQKREVRKELNNFIDLIGRHTVSRRK